MSTVMCHRRRMRRVAAGLCGVMAAVYLAIAAGATSIEPSEEMSLAAFGIVSASIFVVGSGLLLTLDRRPVWAAGAVLQLMIAAMYVAVSAERTPAFEAWGLGLRVLQVPLFVLLVVLAVRPVDAPDERGPTTEPATMSSAGSPIESS